MSKLSCRIKSNKENKLLKRLLKMRLLSSISRDYFEDYKKASSVCCGGIRKAHQDISNIAFIWKIISTILSQLENKEHGTIPFIPEKKAKESNFLNIQK